MHEADVLVNAPAVDEADVAGAPAAHLLSIVIPTLNEADRIEAAIASVRSQDEAHEIIVVDGGSNDATASLAGRHARLIESSSGRARQMNCGAAAARGDVLLFLHADTRLPSGGLRRVRDVINDGAHGGAFRLAFDDWTPLLRLYSLCSRFPVPRLCFGDRGIFIRREIYDEIGGYPEIPLFEDLELVRMLAKRGRFAFLKDHVTTSPRRFLRRGPLRQQLRNTYLWLHYVAGTDPHELQHLYPYD